MVKILVRYTDSFFRKYVRLALSDDVLRMKHLHAVPAIFDCSRYMRYMHTMTFSLSCRSGKPLNILALNEISRSMKLFIVRFHIVLSVIFEKIEPHHCYHFLHHVYLR